MEMRKENLKNTDLDALGVKLLRAGKLRGGEIEEIASRPHLFSSVKAIISSEEFDTKGSVRFSQWNMTAVAAGVLAIIIAAFAGLVAFRNNEPVTQTATQEISSPAIENVPDAIQVPAVLSHAVEKLSAQAKPSPKSRVVSKSKTRKHPPISKPSETGEIDTFYALTYGANLEETTRDGKVIRVDLPPASLFALGVNLPLENDTRLIKTDLLVGPDGITRGIRLVE